MLIAAHQEARSCDSDSASRHAPDGCPRPGRLRCFGPGAVAASAGGARWKLLNPASAKESWNSKILNKSWWRVASCGRDSATRRSAGAAAPSAVAALRRTAWEAPGPRSSRQVLVAENKASIWDAASVTPRCPLVLSARRVVRRESGGWVRAQPNVSAGSDTTTARDDEGPSPPDRAQQPGATSTTEHHICHQNMPCLPAASSPTHRAASGAPE